MQNSPTNKQKISLEYEPIGLESHNTLTWDLLNRYFPLPIEDIFTDQDELLFTEGDDEDE